MNLKKNFALPSGHHICVTVFVLSPHTHKNASTYQTHGTLTLSQGICGNAYSTASPSSSLWRL